MRALLLALLFLATQAIGQVSSSPPLVGAKWTTAPAACAVGQLGFDTDATAGSNIFGCTSANTWTLQGSSSLTIGTTAITGGNSTEVLYNLSGVVQSTGKLLIPATAGQGPQVVAGTAVTAVHPFTITQTRNNAGVTHPGVVWTFTDTAVGATAPVFSITGGSAGTTPLVVVSKTGLMSAVGFDAGTSAFASSANNPFSLSTSGATPRLQMTNSLNTGDLAISAINNVAAATQIGILGSTATASGSMASGTSYLRSNSTIALAIGTLTAKPIQFVTGTGVLEQVRILDTASADRYLTFTGSNAGNPAISASAGNVSFGTGIAFTSLISSPTAVTLASGGCTTPGAVTANGTAAFSLASVGTSCSGSQPLVFTLPAATTGWSCSARNVSNGGTSFPRQTGAASTTSVTITNFNAAHSAAAWTDADVVVVSCLGY